MIANRSVAASDSGNVPCPSSIGFIVAGRFANGDLAVLQALEKRALRFQRNPVDFIEQDDFSRGERAELGDEGARCGVNHLEADDFGRLQVGASLDAGKLRVADRRDDDAEKRFADAGHAAQEKVAGVDLPLLVLVVGRRNLRHEDDVGERLFRLVSDERLAGFGDDGLVKFDGFL
jgi:hypothetical protein